MHPSFEIWHNILNKDMHIAAGVEFCVLASALIREGKKFNISRLLKIQFTYIYPSFKICQIIVTNNMHKAGFCWLRP